MYDRGEHRARSPPIANTRPSSPAEPPISLLDDEGQRAPPPGPQKIRYASVAARNVPHSQTRARTYRSPSAISCAIEPSSSTSRRTGCRPTDKRQPIDTSERPRVGEERGAGAATGERDDPPADRRAEHAEQGRAHELIERIRLRKFRFGDEVGHDGVERGTEERAARHRTRLRSASCARSGSCRSRRAHRARTSRASGPRRRR